MSVIDKVLRAKSISDVSKEIRRLFGQDTDESDGKAIGAKARYSQDMINIRQIRDGMITTKDKRFIAMFRVSPDNILGKTDREQESCFSAFHVFLRETPLKIHFKIVNKPYRPEKIIEDIGRLAGTGTDEYGRLVQAYKGKVHDILSSKSVSREFFVFMEYEEPSAVRRLASEKDIRRELLRRRDQIMRLLDPAVGRTELMTDAEIGRFYYEHFNPETSLRVDYKKRVKRVFEDALRIEGEDDFTQINPPIDDLLAPLDIDLTSHSDYYMIDSCYRCHLALPSSSWKKGYVYPGFLTPLIIRQAGWEVDIYIKKLFPENIRSAIKFTRRLALGISKGARSEEMQDQGAEAYADKRRFLREMEEGAKPLDVSIVFTITTQTHEQLFHTRSETESYFDGLGYALNRLKYNQDLGFLFTQGTMTNASGLLGVTKKNMTSNNAVSIYPFNSYNLNDKNGVPLGVNIQDYSLVCLNVNDQKKYGNSNVVILGATGFGKTYTMQTLLAGNCIMGTQCYSIIPEKENEWKQMNRVLGGTFISLSEGGKDHINIMDIYPRDQVAAQVLDGVEPDANSFLVQKISELLSFFALNIGADLTLTEEQNLSPLLEGVYMKYGITEDNGTLYRRRSDPSSGIKTMPVLGDVYDACEGRAGLERVRTSLIQIVSGHAKSFNQRTNVDLKKRYVTFGIENLTGKWRVLGMYIATNLAMNAMKEDRTKRKLLEIDEAAMLIASTVPDIVAEYVWKSAKLIRGYGGGLILAAQDPSDFFAKEGGKYGSAILSNAGIKIIHHLNHVGLPLLQKTLGLDDRTVERIEKFPRGRAIINYGKTTIPVEIIASDYEFELINTDADLAREIFEKRQRLAV